MQVERINIPINLIGAWPCDDCRTNSHENGRPVTHKFTKIGIGNANQKSYKFHTPILGVPKQQLLQTNLHEILCIEYSF